MHATHWLEAETLWEVLLAPDLFPYYRKKRVRLEPLPEFSTHRPVRMALMVPMSMQEHAAL